MILFLIAAIAVALFGFFAVWVRIAPSSVARFHVDPLKPGKVSPLNSCVIRTSIGAIPIDRLRVLLDDLGLDGETQSLIAGNIAEDYATYEIRTARMRFPDYVSVRLVDQKDRELVIYSRSRFGIRDFGQNEKRVSAWLERSNLTG